MRPATKKLSHQLIKHSQTPLFLALFVESISSIQLIHIILASCFPSSLSSYFSFSSFFREITSYSGAVDLFDPVSSDSALSVVLIALLGYLAILILLFGVLLLNEAKGLVNLARGAWKTLSLLYLFHTRLLFFPVQYFFMGILQINNQCEATSGSFYCKELIQILAILGCIMNVLVGLVQEFLLYSIIKAKNAYAVKNNTFNRMVLVHKVIGIMVFVLQKIDENNDIVAGVAHFALAILCSYVFYINLPFYKGTLMKVRVVYNGLTFGCAGTLLLVAFGVDVKIMEIPWAMLCFLSAKVSLGILREITKGILNGKINTPQKALYFLTIIKEYNFGHFLLDIKRVNYPDGAVLINGSLVRQNFEVGNIKEGKTVKEYENEVFGVVLDKFHTIMNKYPSSVPLALYMAHIYAKRKGNIIQTLNILKKIEGMTSSIALQGSIEEFSRRIKRTYAENHHSMDKNFSLLEYFNPFPAAHLINGMHRKF